MDASPGSFDLAAGTDTNVTIDEGVIVSTRIEISALGGSTPQTRRRVSRFAEAALQSVRGLRLAVVAGVVLGLGMTGLGIDAKAATIQVSQESGAGLGDFSANVLGTITPFNTVLTIVDFYQYSSPTAFSYNGHLNGGPSPASGLSQVFLVNASDGLSLVVVHDKPSDHTGGSAQTRWNLSGDTAAQVVNEGEGNDVFTVSAGGTQFDSTNNWPAEYMDGYAIGSLDGGWSLLGQFVGSPTGIATWAAVSSDFSSIGLALDPGRRVQITSTPLPAAVWLFVTALLGLGGLGYRCRRKQAQSA